MENIYELLTQSQMHMQGSLSAVAHNVSNLQTSGFRQILLHHDRRTDTSKRFFNTSVGNNSYTGNKMDIAISGKGFFKVIDPATGNMFYTRAGRLSKSPTGVLMLQGHILQSMAGSSIDLSLMKGDLNIDASGKMHDEQGSFYGQVGLASGPKDALVESGDGVFFTSKDLKQQPSGSTIQQGFLELSNGQPFRSVAKLVELQRDFESTQNALNIQYRLGSLLIERLSKEKS